MDLDGKNNAYLQLKLHFCLHCFVVPVSFFFILVGFKLRVKQGCQSDIGLASAELCAPTIVQVLL